VPVDEQVTQLQELVEEVHHVDNLRDKLAILDACPEVEAAVAASPVLRSFLAGLNTDGEVAVKSVLALGMGPIVFDVPEWSDENLDNLSQLVKSLVPLEKFYDSIGGIIGYHYTVLQLIANRKEEVAAAGSMRYLEPPGIDISSATPRQRAAVVAGIAGLPSMAEIYPVGGAGDRMNLTDAAQGIPLPSAKLPFGGRTLLEGMIRDLQGREYLYYKLYGEQVTTPIAMMTSQEKNNHSYILGICERSGWFGRPRGAFRFFQQPLVPVVTEDAVWSMTAPLQLTLKPGGHGVVWKLASDAGIFEWMGEQARTKMLVRQINNPVAGLDDSLLAFTGVGIEGDKSFGFASCSRLVDAPEGMNVLRERVTDEGYSYCLTNVEYTEFAAKGLADVPAEKGSCYSLFPCNTNILFADIARIEGLIEECPIPGMTINLKSTAPLRLPGKPLQQVPAGRLETTMQNIADYLVDTLDHPLGEGEEEHLESYLTYNQRRKTISVTKAQYVPGKRIDGTPEGAFYDLLADTCELLSGYCGVTVPSFCNVEEYLKDGPNVMVLYHPALGPNYSIIGQKVRGGRLALGSELQLEIAELDMEHVSVDGSLCIIADQVMGSTDEDGVIVYSSQCGRCTLRNVKVCNEGIDRTATTEYWRNTPVRKETLEIIIHGNGEFFADGIQFRGAHRIEVAAGTRVTAQNSGKGVALRQEPLKGPSWQWGYYLGSDDGIILAREEE